jgi:hypothetical protein
MKELLNRWKSETPVFFKKVQIFGVSLAALGSALVPAIPGQIPTILISVGTSLAALAQFAVTNIESK